MKKQILYHAKRILGIALALCLLGAYFEPIPTYIYGSDILVGAWIHDRDDSSMIDEYVFNAKGEFYYLEYNPYDPSFLYAEEGTYSIQGDTLLTTRFITVIKGSYDGDEVRHHCGDGLTGSGEFMVDGNSFAFTHEFANKEIPAKEYELFGIFCFRLL